MRISWLYRFLVLVPVFTAGTLSIGTCGGEPESRGATGAHATAIPSAERSNIPLLSTADRSSFGRLSRELGGRSGLAVSGVGRRPTIERLGNLSGGVAWSSIKVPIGLTVVRRGDGARNRQLLRRAITASDNQAAEGLWRSLGVPKDAGRAVEKTLAAAGDTTTDVQTKRVRAGFSSFGQTRWPLTSQQRFIAGLRCLRGSGQILSLMGDVIPSQRWGLGSSGLTARFKGGWGPDTSGRYLVRQMGLLQLPNGRPLAVSLATIASDGAFESGARNLTRLARWLASHVNRSALPPPGC
jgi:hypothetical protein